MTPCKGIFQAYVYLGAWHLKHSPLYAEVVHAALRAGPVTLSRRLFTPVVGEAASPWHMSWPANMCILMGNTEQCVYPSTVQSRCMHAPESDVHCPCAFGKH